MNKKTHTLILSDFHLGTKVSHTHKALKKKKGHIHYYNSGCWTDTPSTYIEIDGKNIKIHEY